MNRIQSRPPQKQKQKQKQKVENKKRKKMLTAIYELAMMRRVSFLVFLLCIVISFKNQNADTKKGLNITTTSTTSRSFSYEYAASDPSAFQVVAGALFLSDDGKLEEGGEPYRSMEYDFYRDSCPQAEGTIRAMVRYLHKSRSDVAPALLRLVFHDCFIEGCDASILLDDAEGVDSEKKSPPNESLKGYDVINIIKEELEEICPGVVSCADILALAAREGVVLAGGPFYPLYTGRKDSRLAFADIATLELPSPNADLSETLASFASRGFDLRETVTLLGAHSIGVIHCKFFNNRLHNFGRSNEPDPSLDPDFLNLLRSKCRNISSTSPTPSPPYVDSPSSSAAPSADFDGSVSSSSAPSPNFDGSFSSSAAPSPNFNGSPKSTTALSPAFDASPSSPTASIFSLEALLASTFDEPGINVTYDGHQGGFGTVYYRSLLQNRGVLYADQQLMAGEETGIWVRAYASDVSLFRRDFALAMMKLSNLRVLTGPMGQIRLNCSKGA
ncbi:hypothetical protein WN944_022056 [Citrus x changshan-huyou]